MNVRDFVCWKLRCGNGGGGLLGALTGKNSGATEGGVISMVCLRLEGRNRLPLGSGSPGRTFLSTSTGWAGLRLPTRSRSM